MDLRTIEFAADLVFRLFVEHPELCPHNYEWEWSKRLDDGTEEKHFKCTVCGKEDVVTR